MLDLIHSEQDIKARASDEVYSPRQVRMIRRFASWLRAIGPERLKAMEVLLEDLTRENASTAPR